MDGGRGVLDCSCLPGSIFSPNSWRQDPEQAPRHWHHPHPSRQQIPYRAEPSAWGAGPPGSSKPSWEDLSFPSPPGVGERRDPGAADMPRLHLQPRAPSLQHCGGREPAAASPRRRDLGQASQAQGSAPPRSGCGTWVWLKRMWGSTRRSFEGGCWGGRKPGGLGHGSDCVHVLTCTCVCVCVCRFWEPCPGGASLGGQAVTGHGRCQPGDEGSAP